MLHSTVFCLMHCMLTWHMCYILNVVPLCTWNLTVCFVFRFSLSRCEWTARPLYGPARLWWLQTSAHLTVIWWEPGEWVFNTQFPQSASHSWNYCVKLVQIIFNLRWSLSCTLTTNWQWSKSKNEMKVMIRKVTKMEIREWKILIFIR